jgi:hypothetical protein
MCIALLPAFREYPGSLFFFVGEGGLQLHLETEATDSYTVLVGRAMRSSTLTNVSHHRQLYTQSLSIYRIVYRPRQRMILSKLGTGKPEDEFGDLSGLDVA